MSSIDSRFSMIRPIQYFMHEATEFFVNENLPRFICGEELLNPVDVLVGY